MQYRLCVHCLREMFFLQVFHLLKLAYFLHFPFPDVHFDDRRYTAILHASASFELRKSRFLQRRAALPIIETQKSPCERCGHEELAHTKTRRAATAAPATPAAALVEDEPSGSGSKRRKVQVDPIARDWFLDMLGQWRRVRRWDMQRCLCEVQRLCPGMFDPNSLPLETKYGTSRDARQENFAVARRHDTAERAHHEGDRRPVPQCGDDQRPGARMALRPSQRWVQRLLRGMCPSSKKPAKCLKELHSPALQEANKHRLFIKLCWLMDKHAVSADRVVNINETSCRLLPVHHIAWGRCGVKQAQLQGNTREATTFTVAFSMGRGPLDMLVQIVHAGKTDAVLPEEPWPERTHHVTPRTAGPRRRRSCSSQPHWTACSIQAGRDKRASFSGTWPASTPARPPWPPCGAHSLTSCCASSRRTARRTCSPATWPSSAASRAAPRLKQAPRLPAPSSTAPSKAAEWASRAATDLCDENKAWTTGWHRLRAGSNAEFCDAVAEAAALHAHDELFSKYIEPEPAPEDPRGLGHGRGVRRRRRRAHARRAA